MGEGVTKGVTKEGVGLLVEVGVGEAVGTGVGLLVEVGVGVAVDSGVRVGDGKVRATGAIDVASGSSPVFQQADPLATKTTRTQTTVQFTIVAQFLAKQNADGAARVPLYDI